VDRELGSELQWLSSCDNPAGQQADAPAEYPAGCDFGSDTGICTKMKPTYNWIIGTVPETQLMLQYVAAYQYVPPQQINWGWFKIQSSSFNTDGANPPQDMSSTASQSWLQRYPGGAALWDAGFTPYAADVVSPGPPAMLFVLKATGTMNTRFAWYILNQITLNIGATTMNPACADAGAVDNCWKHGAGEIDFLEGIGQQPIYDADLMCLNSDNPRYGGMQECLVEKSQGESTQKVFSGSLDSPLFIAVVDLRGVTLYVNPVWKNLDEDAFTSTTAADILNEAPVSADSIHFNPLQNTGQIAEMVDTHQLMPDSTTYGNCKTTTLSVNSTRAPALRGHR